MSSIYYIRPTESVSGIPFGEKREAVRAFFGSDYREFKKTLFSKNTTDDYYFFHVYYHDDNTFEAIEFSSGVEIEVDGYRLPHNYDELQKWIKQIDPMATVDSEGITSSIFSIGVYAPDSILESILFGEVNYYRST